MPNYGHIVASTNPEADAGGYKNVFLFALRSDATALQAPNPGGTPALGDTLKITTAHTFGTGKGFFEWACKKHSVTIKSATQGDDGAKTMMHTAEFVLIGDSASTQEQLTRLLNADVVALFKDASQCSSTEYVQLGDDCVSPEFTVEFDGKTTKEGKKEYKVTVACSKKYFYAATVTKAA